MPKVSFSHVPRVKLSDRRGIGFLISDDGRFDAVTKFNSLRDNKARWVRSIMDHWVDGHDRPPWWFHGFDEEEFKACFVFKWDEHRAGQRLYGFKCHPKPQSDKGFLLCVLVFHDQKTDKVDYGILREINNLRRDLQVIEAVGVQYKEFRGTYKWPH